MEMFAWWCSLLGALLLTAPDLAGTTNRQGEGEAGYAAGGDGAGARHGRPITVVGATQAAAGSFPGVPGTPGAGLNLGGDRHVIGDGTSSSPGVNLGGGDGRFGSSGSAGAVVDGSRFGPGRGSTGPAAPLVDGGRFVPGGLRGPGGAGLRGGRLGGVSGQGTSIAEALDAATVTKTITRDFFVTLTDTALNTIPVTLTDFTVRTSIVQKVQVARTPVDDKVALRTEVVLRPKTLTVTNFKSYFRIETDVPVTTVTITHSSYIIKQSTYTTTVTQAITYTSTTVQTAIHTLRQDRTAYHTVTNTVVVSGHYPYY